MWQETCMLGLILSLEADDKPEIDLLDRGVGNVTTMRKARFVCAHT